MASWHTTNVCIYLHKNRNAFSKTTKNIYWDYRMMIIIHVKLISLWQCTSKQDSLLIGYDEDKTGLFMRKEWLMELDVTSSLMIVWTHLQIDTYYIHLNASDLSVWHDYALPDCLICPSCLRQIHCIFFM